MQFGGDVEVWMPASYGFEEMTVWRKARELVRRVYAQTQSRAFAEDRVLAEQIRRAALAIMSNIAQGYERDDNKEFFRFLASAKGSAGEVQSHLHVAFDLGYVEQFEFDELRSLVLETSHLLGSLMKYLQRVADTNGKFT